MATTSRFSNLDNAAYTDPEFLQREKRSLFRSTWQFATRLSAIPASGDAIPVEVGGTPLFVLRDGAGEVRVFANVCPHRGARLLAEPCNVQRSIVCPYHAWAFGLDGTLMGRPHFYGADKHDRANDGEPRPTLWPIRAEVWFDWVFVNIDGQAQPLQTLIEPLIKRLDHYDFSGCVYGGELTFDVPANWKLAHENYLDVLHKFKIHPELEKAAPLRTNSAFEWHGDIAVVDHALENPTEGRGSELPTLPGVSDRVRNLGVAAHLFPNTNFMYWRDQLVLFICEPLGPERTRERFFIYFADSAMDASFSAARQAVLDTWDHLNRQDLRPLEWMQQGRHSDRFDGGSFSPFWDPQIQEYLRRIKHSVG